MRLVRWDPFREMEHMTQHMNRVIDDAFDNAASGQMMAVPLADVFEEDDKLIIHMHIAGLTEDEIDIHVENGVLTVRGERTTNDEEKEKRSYMLRESSTQVMRRMALPKNVDSEKIEAHLNDGILRLELPKKPEAKPKKISVKAKRPTAKK